ncbi:MAG: hypothetical protein H6712_02245 [Myxococcales bacterium]|nr:hypothetical protein [Myxococcales bacterium]MCB9712648.1 hypothetical protein [Myxococcales bacterium]
MLALALALRLLAPSPASAPAEPEPAPSDVASELGEPAPDDYADQAPLDVHTLINDSSKEYLLARARLEEHPVLAAEAILDRLSTVPPPTSTDRKRLLDVLAVLGLPDHAELFAKELRRSLERAQTPTDEAKAVEHWLPLLVDGGPNAIPILTELIADQELTLTVRASLLDALVDVTPVERVTELVGLVGRGARPLRQQLQRSLKRRASRDVPAREALIVATDDALAQAEAPRVAALLKLRGVLSGQDDVDFIARVVALAEDAAVDFPVRVVALRALGQLEAGTAHDSLERVAEAMLSGPERDSQRGELLAWVALQGLPEARVRPLVERHRLLASDAPRLAVLGYAWSSLPDDQSWLAPALDNPWPQVRQAALERVAGPCAPTTAKLLERKAHLAGRKSEDDRAVARSSVQALGRCGDSERLQGLLADEDLDMELRSEAARQLARLGDDASIQAIGRALGRNPDRAFARRLASALRHMPAPTEAGDAVLCETATRADEAGHAARESLRTLHGDVASACE